MAAKLRIFLSAGEASGDMYGALLAEALRERLGTARSQPAFFGCGGDRMRAAGCETLVDAREIAMVGLVEVIPGLPRAWRALRNLSRAVRRQPPDLAVLIDFPDFNLRLAKQLRRAGAPVLYFVAPQVWAWRPWRLATIRRNVDRLLCVFPFEEAYFRQAGVAAEFVGHPLAGRVKPRWSNEEFRSRCGLPQNPTLIALLPGSRRKEILLNLPPMLEAAQRISQGGDYCFALPAASTLRADWIRGLTATAGLPLFVVEDCTYDAVGHAAAAIVASGTATIETALLGTPMVIVYRVSRATWWLGRGLVSTPFYSMVNLIAGRPVAPELIQDQFRPEAVAREMKQLLEVPALRRQMKNSFLDIAERLRPPARPESAGGGEIGDAIQRAAAIAESILLKGLLGTEAPAPAGRTS
jgi:lipid-A-disaccharide synthase